MSITLRIGRGIPSANADSTDQPARGGRYGETFTVGLPNTKHALADEGSYYTAVNPTQGTGIVSNITAAYSATASGFIYMRNTESVTAAAPKRIYLDYIKLMCSVVPGSAVVWQYQIILDYSTAARYTSGGAAPTLNNVNGDSANASVASVYWGPLLTVAGTSQRILCRGNLSTKIPVVYETNILTFGAMNMGGSAIAASGAAYSGRTEIGNPPIVLGASQNLVLFLYGYNNSATAYEAEVEMGWWER